MKRYAPFLSCLLLAALVAGVVYYRKYGFSSPETISDVVFSPLGGAMADLAVNSVGKISPQDISTSLPIVTTMAELPLSFAPAPTGDDDHSHGSDEDTSTRLTRASGARIIRFENADLCFDGLCLMGLFPLKDDGAIDYDNPLFTIHAADIQLSDKMTNGNPELIVDYGPRGGKKRFAWDLNGQFPAYTDIGPAQ